jgi:PAS domain S-box-containing protein
MSSETEPVAAEPAEAFRAAFQELVLERAHDLITVVDPAGTIVYASPSWRSLGWEPEALVGRFVFDLLDAPSADRARAALRQLIGGQRLDEVTLRVQTSDGRWMHAESRGSTIAAADGRVAYILSAARDVTEREELRARVAEVNALYRVADAIARARGLDDLLAEAVDALIEATDADRASVLLYDDAEVMRFRAWHRLSDEYRAATEGHSPWTRDVVDPEPVLVPSLATSGFDDELERVVRAEGIEALAFVPLVHAGRLVGKFMLYHDEPHEWSAREVLLCRTIANHLASATVRTMALEALQASSDQLTTIMRTVDEGIVAQSQGGVLVYANEGAARLIGFESAADLLEADRSEVLGRFEILDEHGEPVSPHDLPGRRALAGEATEQIVRYRTRSTGEERWSIVRANPVLDAAGGVALSISVFHDITPARLADAERRRVEERTRFLARAGELLSESLDYEETLDAIAQMAVPSLAGYLVVDLLEEDGSPRCVAAAHVDPEKTDLVRELRLAYPPTRETHPVQEALRSGRPKLIPDLQAEAGAMAHDEEHAAAIQRLENTSGIVVPLLVRGKPLGTISLGTVAPQPPFDEDDLELAVELARRASVALENARLYREAQARAHAAEALEFVDDGVFLVDGDEIVRLWNPAAARTLGVRATRAIGRPIRDLVHSWDSLRQRIEVAGVPTAGAGRVQTLPVDVHGEERWVSISGVRFPAGTVYAFRDVTEERAVDELKSDFVSTVSHELRTPLSAIYGAALTLQRDDVLLEESQRTGLLDMIASEANRLARIVNAILWASRLDSGQMGIEIESCDAAKLSREVVRALSAHAPSNVTLTLEAPGDLPPVATDPDKLRQVLMNLLDNAVKYSPDGGEVRVALAQVGTRIRFRIQDHGLGIPPAEQGRIFEKFFRLDPNLTRGVGGTGLGLYICRELVQRMHGRIWLTSDGRRGSTFFVELPVAG